MSRTLSKSLEGNIYGIQPVGKPKGRWIEAVIRDDVKMLGMAGWELLVFDRKMRGMRVQSARVRNWAASPVWWWWW
jgi:hypothetical protein